MAFKMKGPTFYGKSPLEQHNFKKVTPKDPLPVGLPYSEAYLKSRGISIEDYKKLIESRLDDQKRKQKKGTIQR